MLNSKTYLVGSGVALELGKFFLHVFIVSRAAR